MWLVLQHERPEDFVIGTGEVHSVREFTEKAFEHVGINIVYVLCILIEQLSSSNTCNLFSIYVVLAVYSSSMFITLLVI